MKMFGFLFLLSMNFYFEQNQFSLLHLKERNDMVCHFDSLEESDSIVFINACFITSIVLIYKRRKLGWYVPIVPLLGRLRWEHGFRLRVCGQPGQYSKSPSQNKFKYFLKRTDRKRMEKKEKKREKITTKQKRTCRKFQMLGQRSYFLDRFQYIYLPQTMKFYFISVLLCGKMENITTKCVFLCNCQSVVLYMETLALTSWLSLLFINHFTGYLILPETIIIHGVYKHIKIMKIFYSELTW